jgi:hypothetical protein
VHISSELKLSPLREGLPFDHAGGISCTCLGRVGGMRGWVVSDAECGLARFGCSADGVSVMVGILIGFIRVLLLGNKYIGVDVGCRAERE